MSLLMLLLMTPILQVPTPIEAALADTSRPDEERARDARRKPGEILQFFGIGPGQRVAELMSGTGYYSGILARVVGEKGSVISHNSPFVVNRFKQRLGPGGVWEQKSRTPPWKAVTRRVAPLEKPGLGTDLDAVIIVLFYHDTYWQEVDRVAMNKAVFDALKPGGVYGIVDHSAQVGSGDRDVQSLHRVDEELVKAELKAAGFVLDGESDVLRNPRDARDYNVFRDFRTNRDQTDRFVLRFRKPE